MPKSKSSASHDIIAAAETIYAILAESNVKACAIGSMAIAYTTKKSFGRDPNSLDFATFQRGHNQRTLNDLLIASRPDSFIVGNQSVINSHLPPVIFYKPQNSSLGKIRVFFLPLWTRHSQENIPRLDYDDVVEPKSPHTVPLAPLPFLVYLQLHGWTWNDSIVRQNPTNKRANTKRDNFANDLGFLLPLAVKRRAHFDWLPDEFKERLKDNASAFVQYHPAFCKDWSKMGSKSTKGGGKPNRTEEKPKGNGRPRRKEKSKQDGPTDGQVELKPKKGKGKEATRAIPKKIQLKPVNAMEANPRGVYPIKEIDPRDAKRDRAERRERKLKLRKDPPMEMPIVTWMEGKNGGVKKRMVKDQLDLVEFDEAYPGELDFND